MNPAHPNNTPGQFAGPGEIRFVRLLPGPIGRVWDYLTDAEKRGQWFAGGPFEPRVGGRIELRFMHCNLAPDETPPPGAEPYHYAPGTVSTGTITRWEPPHALGYTFGEHSEVLFELRPEGELVRLLLTHRSAQPDWPHTADFATGWHLHLNHLLAELAGAPRPPLWSARDALHAAYGQARAAASSRSGNGT
jgi:uncharacterized protein YndB with AHSA1/START domain